MSNQPIILQSYGLNQPIIGINPSPIIARRAPTVNDRAQLGQIWIQPTDTAGVAVNGAWILTSILANVATWSDTTGGAGVFTSLVVTPGPISLTGTTTINTTGAATTSIGSTTGASGIALLVGTGNFSLDGAATSTYSIGASTTSGTMSIGGTGANTGTISIAPGTGAQQILIADGNTGVKSVAIAAGTVANIVTMGSTTGAASTTISGGTGGVSMVTAAPSVATGGIFMTQGAATSRIMVGAGAPNNNLAINVGDLYVNSTAASAVTRLYIATAAGTWTNITCAA